MLHNFFQSTASHCGHKFCRKCLDDWTALKPICPVCGDEIRDHEKIRLYEDDHFIEEHLLNFSKHSMMRWQKAKSLRAERRQHVTAKWNIFGRCRKSLDEWILLYKCKGLSSVFRKGFQTGSSILKAPLRLLRSSGRLGDLIPRNTFILGVVIGILAATFAHNRVYFLHFIQYLYLAIKKYDGIVPPYLDSAQVSNLEATTSEEDKINSFFAIVKPRPAEYVPSVSLDKEMRTSEFDNVFSFIAQWFD